jgi:hypothetical protein
VNGEEASGPLQVTSTYDPADPLAWRQWHHWNLASQLFKFRLSGGDFAIEFPKLADCLFEVEPQFDHGEGTAFGILRAMIQSTAIPYATGPGLYHWRAN